MEKRKHSDNHETPTKLKGLTKATGVCVLLLAGGCSNTTEQHVAATTKPKIDLVANETQLGGLNVGDKVRLYLGDVQISPNKPNTKMEERFNSSSIDVKNPRIVSLGSGNYGFEMYDSTGISFTVDISNSDSELYNAIDKATQEPIDPDSIVADKKVQGATVLSTVDNRVEATYMGAVADDVVDNITVPMGALV